MSRSTVLTIVFLSIAGLLAAAALQYSAWVHFASGTRPFYVMVEDVGGLREGTEIIMAGYQVGEVAEIAARPLPTLHFDLELRVRDEIPVPEGTVAVIASRGFGGSRVLELHPPAGEGHALLPPDARLEARSEPSLADVIVRADQAFRQLGEVASELRDFAGADASRPGLRQTAARAERTLEEVNTTLDAVQSLLDRLEETAESVDVSFDQGIEDFSATMESVQGTVARVDGLLVREEPKLDTLLTEAEARLRQLGELLDDYDRESFGDLDAALADLRAASQDLAALMAAMKDRPLHTLRKGVGEEAETPTDP